MYTGQEQKGPHKGRCGGREKTAEQRTPSVEGEPGDSRAGGRALTEHCSVATPQRGGEPARVSCCPARILDSSQPRHNAVKGCLCVDGQAEEGADRQLEPLLVQQQSAFLAGTECPTCKRPKTCLAHDVRASVPWLAAPRQNGLVKGCGGAEPLISRLSGSRE